MLTETATFKIKGIYASITEEDLTLGLILHVLTVLLIIESNHQV